MISLASLPGQGSWVAGILRHSSIYIYFSGDVEIICDRTLGKMLSWLTRLNYVLTRDILIFCHIVYFLLCTILSMHIKQYIKLYFNRAKLLTKIHDGEVKSQSFQVGDWLILPSIPQFSLQEGRVMARGAWALSCVIDRHNHHRGPPAGGREHRPGCDHWDWGREEAKHSEGRNQQPVL